MNQAVVAAGAPNSPWGMEGTGIPELLNQWLGWLLWAGLAASVAAMILFATLMIIDRERGQAISATAPQVEALGWAVGVAVMCAAGQIARSLLG